MGAIAERTSGLGRRSASRGTLPSVLGASGGAAAVTANRNLIPAACPFFTPHDGPPTLLAVFAWEVAFALHPLCSDSRRRVDDEVRGVRRVDQNLSIRREVGLFEGNEFIILIEVGETLRCRCPT